MSKLYNYTIYFKGKKTYTASCYEEALYKLSDDYENVDVEDCDAEEYDPYEDDYMS